MASAPGNKLKKFLQEIGQDPRKWAEFEENPDAVMEAAGLSKAHRNAIKSRNADKIRKALGAGPRAFMCILLRFK